MTHQVQCFLKLQLFCCVVNLPWERENLRKLGAETAQILLSLMKKQNKTKQNKVNHSCD
jgi:hypothetical protein